MGAQHGVTNTTISSNYNDLYEIAHKCQPSSKDQAHHTDTTATLQSHHEKSTVV